MPFADVFSGFEQAASDHYSKLLEMQYGQRRDAAASIAKMADDPRFDEASSMALKHRALDIIGGDPMKPLSSKDTDVSQILVQPPTPPKQQVPGGTVQGATSSGIPPILASQATLQPGSFQPPTPPPHPADQMMPYEQQIERERQRALATHPTLGKMTNSYTSVDEQGNRFKIEEWTNPYTGESQLFKSGSPVAYAPRLISQGLNIQDEQVLAQHGITLPLHAPSPQLLDEIQKLLPGVVARTDTASGNIYLQSPTFRPESYNGQVNQVPVTPPSGQPLAGAQVAGQANTTLPRTTQGTQTIPLPGGRIGVTGTQRTTTTQLPGAPAPPPQAQPQAPAPPPGTPPAGIPDLTQGPTPEAVQFVMSQNRNLTEAQVKSALEQNRQAAGAPQQVPAPAPPPGAGAPKVGEAREIPGAGRGLSADDVLKVKKQGTALTNTVERMANVLNKADLLKSLVVAGKVAFAVDPSQTKLLISRMTGLTPAETSLAKDYASLSEDINILRTVYGIAPSRGQQAFQALQLQKGALLGDVGVFKGTLQNTLKSVVDQMVPMNQSLGPAKEAIPFGSGMAQAYLLLNGMDKEKARAAALKDGWRIP